MAKEDLRHIVSLCKQTSDVDSTDHEALQSYRMLKELSAAHPNKIPTYEKIMQELYSKMGSYISLKSSIGSNLQILGGNVYISDNVTIENDCTIGSNVSLGNYKNKDAIHIGNNVTLHSGVKVFGVVNIGDNVEVSPNCIVLEDVDKDKKVEIVNQLQVTENQSKNYLPSQQMLFYGIYPKFKNTFVIIGEGFYNPTVLLKVKDKSINYNITYWDKNKIIVKIKNSTPFSEDTAKKVKLILLCRDNKIVVLNSLGLEKTLISLS